VSDEQVDKLKEEAQAAIDAGEFNQESRSFASNAMFLY